MSFSTKIVDYFEMAKCILAVGPDDIASIQHLKENNAAIFASSEKEIYEKIKEIAENPELRYEFGRAAFECGRRNHDIHAMQGMLWADMNEIAGEKE